MILIPGAGAIQQIGEGGDFLGAGGADAAEAEGELNSVSIALSIAGEDALRKSLGCFCEDFVVEGDQRLERRVGSCAGDGGGVGIGAVEGGEIGMGSGALEEGVHGAAMAVFAGAGFPLKIVGVAEGGDVGRQGREDAGAADFI